MQTTYEVKITFHIVQLGKRHYLSDCDQYGIDKQMKDENNKWFDPDCTPDDFQTAYNESAEPDCDWLFISIPNNELTADNEPKIVERIRRSTSDVADVDCVQTTLDTEGLTTTTRQL